MALSFAGGSSDRTISRAAFKASFSRRRCLSPYGGYIAALDAAGAAWIPISRASFLREAARERQRGDLEAARSYLHLARRAPRPDLP